jgi:bifunctional DNA-binding transcriptional regulator/antitoxin component of YhaV-PrlF toxin-antitoxin module
MAYKTKIQLIERKTSEQWYIFFPMAIARAMEFEKSEEIEIIIQSKSEILIKRQKEATPRRKRKS